MRSIASAVICMGLGCLISSDTIAETPPSTENEVVSNNADSATKTTPEKSEAKPASAKPVRTPEYWIKQLGHSEFLRRENAMKRLIESGDQAVPALINAIKMGDLETTTRAIGVLSDVALSQAANDDDGAWGALKRLSENSTGSRQATAGRAVREIADDREVRAFEALKTAGVSIGFDNYAVGSLTSQKFVLRIDDKWNQNPSSLHWLRWIRKIEYVSIREGALTRDVVASIVKMPDVHTISLIDGTLDADTVTELNQMPRIKSLEVRYIDLNPELTDLIASLPIRESLNLMGTGVTRSRVEKMRADLPGLSIEYKNGGFLGVTCNTFGVNRCEIREVIPGSAADKAGLQSRDIVTGIDDEAVAVFADLQKIISGHVPGDTVLIQFQRFGREQTTQLKLGKQLDQ